MTNNKDKKYLKEAVKLGLSLEGFNKMVELLKDKHNRINQLFTEIDNTLLKTLKTT